MAPTLFIHGEADKFIDKAHTVDLAKASTNAKKRKVMIRDNMTHNEFDFLRDLCIPIRDFVKENLSDRYLETSDRLSESGKMVKKEVKMSSINPIYYENIDFHRYFRRVRIKT